jgi:hypothetical protein
MSSSQLTHIFQRGRSTSNQLQIYGTWFWYLKIVDEAPKKTETRHFAFAKKVNWKKRAVKKRVSGTNPKIKFYDL